ncbi:MAG TPA: hypothetical protein VK105_18910 [Virgibacillus sp.]|nr:hypothetical protein [Virgibacillus sp.]HLR69160.1 hypothetical protein [Virgibacillus sp.]
MIQFKAFSGTVVSMNDLHSSEYGEGCTKMIALQNAEGAQVNFILMPSTYVVNQDMIAIGDAVTGYYNANAPAILIYPPQYQALIMVKEQVHENIKVGYFNSDLISNDHQLKLNIHPYTQIITTNGQSFTGNIVNRTLIVIYGASTKSIPAQTTPYKIIVLC